MQKILLYQTRNWKFWAFWDITATYWQYTKVTLRTMGISCKSKWKFQFFRDSLTVSIFFPEKGVQILVLFQPSHQIWPLVHIFHLPCYISKVSKVFDVETDRFWMSIFFNISNRKVILCYVHCTYNLYFYTYNYLTKKTQKILFHTHFLDVYA